VRRTRPAGHADPPLGVHSGGVQQEIGGRPAETGHHRRADGRLVQQAGQGEQRRARVPTETAPGERREDDARLATPHKRRTRRLPGPEHLARHVGDEFSPQNAFEAGKVAMLFDGEWRNHRATVHAFRSRRERYDLVGPIERRRIFRARCTAEERPCT
jgi:hypothetical protein